MSGSNPHLWADESAFDFGAVDECVAGARAVAVIGHIRPDADAIGSVNALVEVLGNRGIDAKGFIGYRGQIDATLRSLPGTGRISFTGSLPGKFDTVITVDCGDLGRTGLMADAVGQRGQAGRLVVIDHHATNPGFGSLNCVAGGWESTTLLLWRWFVHSGDSITPTIAHNLYAGLVSDTGSFRWGSARMHVMARAMVEAGVDSRAIATDLFDRTSVGDLALKGRILAGMRVVEVAGTGYRFCALVADHDTIAGHTMAAVESLCGTIRAVDGTDFGVLVKEYVPGTWQVSFRSSGLVISPIAVRLGGGGHDLAAGCTIVADSADAVTATIAEAAGQELSG
ncbi:bifunctional oligoribonuclease/PAP phosphatase NrnA [Corynebacterium mendelii]|uniref:Bifunctional oligoribonuclease/PAP phosphatase NrnA n=1 Tax=Corynebacterium mendelii TaxID=2765362 RepID=A0A939E0G5_9CORY|nr:bifunctional oligoribonuclease/PAP phosphatase NrnA [Corynebacterium mendelii]MBN9643272.1 bifunctional oligoribonuclease/PAP phosphatase NrnA [Corynebacterium mendelii]